MEAWTGPGEVSVVGGGRQAVGAGRGLVLYLGMYLLAV